MERKGKKDPPVVPADVVPNHLHSHLYPDPIPDPQTQTRTQTQILPLLVLPDPVPPSPPSARRLNHSGTSSRPPAHQLLLSRSTLYVVVVVVRVVMVAVEDLVGPSLVQVHVAVGMLGNDLGAGAGAADVDVKRRARGESGGRTRIPNSPARSHGVDQEGAEVVVVVVEVYMKKRKCWRRK